MAVLFDLQHSAFAGVHLAGQTGRRAGRAHVGARDAVAREQATQD